MAGNRSIEPKPARDPSRRLRYESLRMALADTEVGRDFDLARLATFADFQASIPLLDPETHAARVTTKLGFDLAEFPDADLAASDRDRPELIDIWRHRLLASGGDRSGMPRRVALLHATADDPAIDRMRLADLAALCPGLELLRIGQFSADPSAQVDELVRFRPDTLFMPSLATCSWLETAQRAPLERSFSHLRWMFAESDLDQRIRSRLPVINGGWLHVAGRIGLPTRRSPWHGFSLATCSSLLELLPHDDPEADPRDRVDSRGTRRCVLPEQAVLGERYELVVSSPLGFLRLRTGQHVRVVGFVPPAFTRDDDLPRPRVVRLPPPPADVSLEGVTLPGAPLTACVRQAFNREDPALVAAEIDSDLEGRVAKTAGPRGSTEHPFGDTELGASRVGFQRGPRPKGLLVRVEVQGQTDAAFAPRLARRVDEALRARSPAYEWLRGRDELFEVRVIVSEPGAARRARERRIRALAGPVERPMVRVRG